MSPCPPFTLSPFPSCISLSPCLLRYRLRSTSDPSLVFFPPHPPSAPSPQGEGPSNLAFVHSLNILLFSLRSLRSVFISPFLLVLIFYFGLDCARPFRSPCLPISLSPCLLRSRPDNYRERSTSDPSPVPTSVPRPFF